MKGTPAFCSRCGQSLTFKKTLHGYDIYSGEKQFEGQLLCPDKHESYRLDPWALKLDGTADWVRDKFYLEASTWAIDRPEPEIGRPPLPPISK